MAIPETCKSFRRNPGDVPLTISPATEALPKELGATDVLLKVHAVSLNFRDVAMLNGRYVAPFDERGIVASDCAAEVVAVGSGVKNFAVGDRVSPTFFPNILTGDEEEPQLQSLGGDVPGVLSEYAVFDEKTLVRLPEHLSWEEASTITCAGVTAWNALNGVEGLSKGSSVLLEGTGGVSMFALLLLIAVGVRPIVTSSSDEKIESVKKLSPLVEGINYRTHPDPTAEVYRLTNGKGAKIVVNNGGVQSIPSNLGSVGSKGTISLVGFLGGFAADWNPSSLMGLMAKSAKLQGITVGSKADFEALNKFLADKKIQLHPLIDRTFALDDSKEAFDYLYSGKHVGKVVIKM